LCIDACTKLTIFTENRNNIDIFLYTTRSSYEFAGRRREADDVLEREPADTAGLDECQVLVVGRHVAVLVDRRQRRHRVDCQRDCRHDDEQNRYDRKHLYATAHRRLICHHHHQPLLSPSRGFVLQQQQQSASGPGHLLQVITLSSAHAPAYLVVHLYLRTCNSATMVIQC